MLPLKSRTAPNCKLYAARGEINSDSISLLMDFGERALIIRYDEVSVSLNVVQLSKKIPVFYIVLL